MKDNKSAILEAVKKLPWMTCAEISKYTNIDVNCVYASMSTYMSAKNPAFDRRKNGRGYEYAARGTIQQPVVQVTAPEPAKIELVNQCPSIDEMIRQAVSSVVSALAARIEEDLKVEISKAFQEVPARVMAHIHSSPVADTKPRKSSVAIVGLWPKQMGHITSEFHDCFDFRLYSADDLAKIGEGCANVDHVVLMTGHVSHKHTEILRAAGCKPLFVNGGLTALRETLTELYAQKT